MITVLPFSRSDLDRLALQEEQRAEAITPERVARVEHAWSFTVIDGQARVLMCAGAVPDEDGIWWGWALLSVFARQRLLALSRATLFVLARAPADRIRIMVQWTFTEGHRWARMLGFVPARELHRVDGIWFAVYERSIRHGV